MQFLKTFCKSIFVGLGGVAPGLSGSVMMIIFGLYQDTVDALGTLFVNFKKKIMFLLPIALGMGVGMLLFSKLLDFFLETFPMQTRFTFLGLILGTVPLFYKEVKKKGFAKRYYLYIAAAVLAGVLMFTLNPNVFPQITSPNLLQKMLLGFAVATSSIVPGIDSAVVLSTLGLYETYVSALANLDFGILIPMAVGLAIGIVGVPFVVSRLLKRFYTASFSVVFGLFLSIIPNILDESCFLGWNAQSVISIALMLLGFVVSFYLEDIETNNERIQRFINKRKKQE